MYRSLERNGPCTFLDRASFVGSREIRQPRVTETMRAKNEKLIRTEPHANRKRGRLYFERIYFLPVAIASRLRLSVRSSALFTLNGRFSSHRVWIYLNKSERARERERERERRKTELKKKKEKEKQERLPYVVKGVRVQPGTNYW